MRKQGRATTPDWVEVPNEDRHKFSKISFIGDKQVSLPEYLIPRFYHEKDDWTPCGCSGRHFLSECPLELEEQRDDSETIVPEVISDDEYGTFDDETAAAVDDIMNEIDRKSQKVDMGKLFAFASPK